MKRNILESAIVMLLVTLLAPQSIFQIANAHDAGNLNEVIIERTNQSAVKQVLAVQNRLTALIRSSGESSTWPDADLQGLSDDLRHLQEDLVLSLDYFANQGLNLQNKDVLKENPIAGRAVAANRAVETGMALLNHIGSLDNRNAFVQDIYSRGLSYYMYDLVGAYQDKLSLYEELLEAD